VDGVVRKTGSATEANSGHRSEGAAMLCKPLAWR